MTPKRQALINRVAYLRCIGEVPITELWRILGEDVDRASKATL